MKHLLALLSVFFVLGAHANEGPSVKQQEEKRVYELEADQRCFAPIKWSGALVTARLEGTTRQQILDDMTRDYHNGPLEKYPNWVISMMLDIVDVVYNAEAVKTDEEIIAIFKRVNGVCLDHVTRKPKKKESRST